MGVGWVFTVRLPVRGVKTQRPVKKLAVTLKDGAKPTIGTTLTPVKKATGAKAAPVKKVAKKATKVAAKTVDAKSDAPKKVANVKKAEAPKKPAPPKKSDDAKKVVKKAAVKKTAKKTAKEVAPIVEATPALRRGRQPVNPEVDFGLFTSAQRIGSKFDGEVTAFTSHGAVIKVTLKTGQQIECYAPTTGLGTPVPQRARDVLKRGDKRRFSLVKVDVERRIAELALS
jgi:hypothetical protein